MADETSEETGASSWRQSLLERASKARAAGEKAGREVDGLMRYTRREIEGAIQALNIFFGAVIGISLAGIDEAPVEIYVVILILTASAIMMILLVSNTHRRISQSIMMIIMLGVIWMLFESEWMTTDLEPFVPEKLLPTLMVWGAMALSTEFMPRLESDRDPDAD